MNLSASRILTMLALVISGEVIYSLVYALSRDFKSSILETFQLTNVQLGSLNSAFGILAILCYFPGGRLADKFSPRVLLTFSLLATSAGGFIMATIPSYPVLLGLYAWWGITTILTFWAALIKATRIWGGSEGQGKAFGLLDGGRGVTGGALAALFIAFYSTFQNAPQGLQAVIVSYSVAIACTGILVWFTVEDQPPVKPTKQKSKQATSPVIEVLKNSNIWLISLIIMTAYCGYWGTFNFAKYSEDVFGYTPVQAALLGSSVSWLRPIAAIVAGALSDKFRASRLISISFFMLALGYASTLLSSDQQQGVYWVLWMQVFAISTMIFCLRGIYYALLEECQLPKRLTGTAVGIVSVIGYTPDIFLPLLVGYLLDTYTGATGHHIYYGILSVIALLGFGAVLLLRKRIIDFRLP